MTNSLEASPPIIRLGLALAPTEWRSLRRSYYGMSICAAIVGIRSRRWNFEFFPPFTLISTLARELIARRLCRARDEDPGSRMLQTPPPPAPADLSAMGVTAAQVICSTCRHSATLDFARLPLPASASFPALDVMFTEPPTSDDPLWHHPKIFVTPHVAAFPHPRTASMVVANQLKRFAR